MTRPPNMSDRLPTHIKDWMANRTASRLVESQTTAAERTAAAMMDHATEEPMKSHPMQPHIDAWRATRDAEVRAAIERLCRAVYGRAATTAEFVGPSHRSHLGLIMDAAARIASLAAEVLELKKRLAIFDALGSYEVVKATCDDHARMVREREAEAWVSVEERLPNDSETKLVWLLPGCAIMGRAVAAQLQGGRWCRVDGGGWRWVASVTHWRPIVPPVPR